MRPKSLLGIVVFFSISCLSTDGVIRAAELPVTLVWGSWLPGEVATSISAPRVPLVAPFGIDFCSNGDMIIVELTGGRVHRLAADGPFSTISGDGSTGFTGDGGPAREATYNGMHNVAVTPDDHILIADSWNHCVRRIDAKTGTVTTLAGTGEPGFSGDGGPATEATFDYVMCITLSLDGSDLYVADLKNRRIRRINLDQNIVTTVAGNGQKGVPDDGAVAVASPLVDPRAVAVDSKQNVYVLERGGHALRVVSTDGRIRTVAGNGKPGSVNGPADQSQLNSPKHLCVDGNDRVWIADDRNATIRLFDPESGKLSTVLGNGQGQPAVRLKNPHGVCVEKHRLYVVDTGNNRILQMPLPR